MGFTCKMHVSGHLVMVIFRLLKSPKKSPVYKDIANIQILNLKYLDFFFSL